MGAGYGMVGAKVQGYIVGANSPKMDSHVGRTVREVGAGYSASGCTVSEVGAGYSASGCTVSEVGAGYGASGCTVSEVGAGYGLVAAL